MPLRQTVSLFPLTNMIVALIKMTPGQRHNASAQLAATRYDLPLAWCQYWIDHACTMEE